jgi:hypothetical protein
MNKFADIWIYNNNMTSMGFAALKAINNTRITGENIEFYTYWQNLNGYARFLVYEANGW